MFFDKRHILQVDLSGSPIFDPLFKMRQCWFLLDTVIKSVPQETTLKRQYIESNAPKPDVLIVGSLLKIFILKLCVMVLFS